MNEHLPESQQVLSEEVATELMRSPHQNPEIKKRDRTERLHSRNFVTRINVNNLSRNPTR